jgi:hypothetical protein
MIDLLALTSVKDATALHNVPLDVMRRLFGRSSGSSASSNRTAEPMEGGARNATTTMATNNGDAERSYAQLTAVSQFRTLTATSLLRIVPLSLLVVRDALRRALSQFDPPLAVVERAAADLASKVVSTATRNATLGVDEHDNDSDDEDNDRNNNGSTKPLVDAESETMDERRIDVTNGLELNERNGGGGGGGGDVDADDYRLSLVTDECRRHARSNFHQPQQQSTTATTTTTMTTTATPTDGDTLLSNALQLWELIVSRVARLTSEQAPSAEHKRLLSMLVKFVATLNNDALSVEQRRDGDADVLATLDAEADDAPIRQARQQLRPEAVAGVQCAAFATLARLLAPRGALRSAQYALTSDDGTLGERLLRDWLRLKAGACSTARFLTQHAAAGNERAAAKRVRQLLSAGDVAPLTAARLWPELARRHVAQLARRRLLTAATDDWSHTRREPLRCLLDVAARHASPRTVRAWSELLVALLNSASRAGPVAVRDLIVIDPLFNNLIYYEPNKHLFRLKLPAN